MHYIATNLSQRSSKAFSLVETLVAVALFSIIAVSMVGTITTLIAESRKVRTQKVAMDNLNAALESIAREIRNGTDPVITNGNTRIQFEPERGDGDSATKSDQIVYTRSGTQIMRSLDGGSTWEGLTDPALTVSSLYFEQKNTAAGAQPAVLITVVGQVGADAKTSSSFSLQTTTAVHGSVHVIGGTSSCAATVIGGFLSRLLFDDASSGFIPTTAQDEASAITATLHNGARWGEGKWCNAIWFDGVDDYVDYPLPRYLDFANLYQTGGFTISAWVNPTSLVTPNPGKCGYWVDPVTGEDLDCEAFVIAQTDEISSPNGWSFSILPGGHLSFAVDNFTARPPRRVSDSHIVTGVWRHVAVTWNGTNSSDEIRLYVDGDLEPPYLYEHNPSSGNFGDDSANSMTIGACAYGCEGREVGKDFVNTYSHGAIDDFRIYRGVLNGTQIKDLAQQGSYTVRQSDF